MATGTRGTREGTTERRGSAADGQQNRSRGVADAPGQPVFMDGTTRFIRPSPLPPICPAHLSAGRDP
jgi:hypothetical protein